MDIEKEYKKIADMSYWQFLKSRFKFTEPIKSGYEFSKDSLINIFIGIWNISLILVGFIFYTTVFIISTIATLIGFFHLISIFQILLKKKRFNKKWRKQHE